jgi:hypothetical protein
VGAEIDRMLENHVKTKAKVVINTSLPESRDTMLLCSRFFLDTN